MKDKEKHISCKLFQIHIPCQIWTEEGEDCGRSFARPGEKYS